MVRRLEADIGFAWAVRVLALAELALLAVANAVSLVCLISTECKGAYIAWPSDTATQASCLTDPGRHSQPECLQNARIQHLCCKWILLFLGLIRW